MSRAQGPLCGVRIVEFAGLGPTPFAAMLLADLGADVVRIERPGAPALIPQKTDFMNRGRRYVALDLKSDAGRGTALDMLRLAEASIEGMRPGAMERLGLGPDPVLAVNPALVYGRMTGWGQEGPLSHTAGQDINYIALTGALHAMGDADKPAVPLNLVGDFGGGALYLVMGMLAGLLHARQTGEGQVVDAAITDGTLSLMTIIYSLAHSQVWQDSRAGNLLDGAAPFYTTYACKDGGHVAVGALEPQFYAALLAGLELDHTELPSREDRTQWPRLRQIFSTRFAERTRDAWDSIFADSDACVAPVLSLSEAPTHPHMAARQAFVEVGGVVQPAPAPRLSRTPGAVQGAEPDAPIPVDDVLQSWGSAPDQT